MTITAISSSFSPSVIDDVLNYAARFRKSYGFLVVVLDHIDDEQSHIATLTSQLYPILKKNVRATDTLIRFTQDSWLICIDDCDDHQLQWTHYVLTSTLNRRLIQVDSPFEGALTTVRGAILEADTLNQAIRTFEQEIQLAKNSLHRLKMMRSTVIVSEDPQSNLTTLVHKAILDNRLFLSFQPIVDAHTRQLHHFECLARILDDDGQILLGGQFIAGCEKSGLIQLVDQKIQQLAIEELMSNRHLKLAFNVSPITACDPLWLNTLKTHMSAYPDLKGRLIIELTETAVFQDVDESARFITQLRDLGCLVSIDDFGAGYMSMNHLKSDLIQTVKIDAQFVKALKEDPNNINFIRAIIALTQPHGIQCIAEGIEDEETAHILAEENVDFLQGYHIGRPSHIRGWM
ncbi:MAG: GGDEF domain-containing phosphodiesterase [Alphaproteobacteria bacterium]|jgi:EAL domain-containing protein (putative c-di-GMP-specific phosphodiesterase class I)|nr:GGDEF domain-containing phosphodiesterase [Alphaproteobacteria bacterium]